VLYTAPIAPDEPSRIGFIVSKAVGNAVTRNLVKRRLREAGALSLSTYGTGLAVVVRALPAAAASSWDQLLADYNAALRVTTKKLAGRVHSGEEPAAPDANDTTEEGTPRA
jgi:ribonuclease P protein component